MFDISTGDCVAECKDGHDANVTRILSMYDRYDARPHKGTRAQHAVKHVNLSVCTCVQNSDRLLLGRLVY